MMHEGTNGCDPCSQGFHTETDDNGNCLCCGEWIG